MLNARLFAGLYELEVKKYTETGACGENERATFDQLGGVLAANAFGDDLGSQRSPKGTEIKINPKINSTHSAWLSRAKCFPASNVSYKTLGSHPMI